MLPERAKPAVAAGNNEALPQPDTQIPAGGGDKPGGEKVTTYRLELR
jgi:hypothetical protein